MFGLEPTPELYLEHSVAIFREAWRVLRKDGTLWINLGDSFAGSGSGPKREMPHHDGREYDGYLTNGRVPVTDAREIPRVTAGTKQARNTSSDFSAPHRNPSHGLKAGDMVGIPWRVALALQAPHYTGRIKSEADRVWLAAMLDAEGCLFIHKRKSGQHNGQGYHRKNDNYGPGIEISNTSRAIITEIQRITRLGSVCEQGPNENHRRKQNIYRWNLRTIECRELVRELYPYLIAKKHQARIMCGCPSSGPAAEAAHAALIDLHRGRETQIDFSAPLPFWEDGYTLRRDNIWSKNNPMPESVSGWRWEQHRVKTKAGWTKETHPSAQGGSDKSRSDIYGSHNNTKPSENSAEFVDCPGCSKCEPNGGLVLRKGNWRCTTSHEYVFQFSKSADYFCDAEAARERTTGNAHGRGHGVNPKAEQVVAGEKRKAARSKQNSSFSAAVAGLSNSRNLRSVWRIPTKPYAGAHFATFPTNLVRPIIKAAAPSKCCSACGAPWAPIVQRGEPRREQQLACGSNGSGEYHGTATKDYALTGAENPSAVKARILAGMVEKKVVGLRATCRCNAPAARGVVLDMFGGSGTVGQVAHEEGRDAILIEISAEYQPLIRKRCHVTPGLGI